ncbi:MAG: ABC transporter permease [Chloroflexota bacterium]|nr:ABC transporter permease [Chloroflexota bacterium]
MSRFVTRRLLQAIPTFFGITLITFALFRLSPGDPVDLLVFGVPDMTAAQVAALRHAYGLDQPVPIQYLNWLLRFLHGDFGQSFLYHRPVVEMIGSALPNTIQLALAALLLALVIGVPLGAVAARSRGSRLDQAIRIVAVGGHAVPGFWFGLMFILVLSVQVPLFPVSGMLTLGASQWDIPDRLWHLVGPALTLSLAGIANYSRLMRTEILDVIRQDFVRTARAKGLREQSVLMVHALRNALLPLITGLGGVLAFLVSGAVIVESVFSWPGMGRLAYEAARSKDYPIVMAVVVISSTMLLVSYILRDIAYSVADPRVRR